MLLDHLLERGGTVRFHTELTGLQVTDAACWPSCATAAPGRRSRVRARYLVGADGPRSTVRAALGIGVDDLGTFGDFVSVTFRAELTRRLPRVPLGASTRCRPRPRPGCSCPPATTTGGSTPGSGRPGRS